MYTDRCHFSEYHPVLVGGFYSAFFFLPLSLALSLDQCMCSSVYAHRKLDGSDD